MTEMRRCRGTFCPLNTDSSSFRISWVKLYLAWSLHRCEMDRRQSKTQLQHTHPVVELQFFLANQPCVALKNSNPSYSKTLFESSAISTEPQYIEGVSGQQQVQPLIGRILLHQAHDTVWQKTQSSNRATTELKNQGVHRENDMTHSWEDSPTVDLRLLLSACGTAHAEKRQRNLPWHCQCEAWCSRSCPGLECAQARGVDYPQETLQIGRDSGPPRTPPPNSHARSLGTRE